MSLASIDPLRFMDSEDHATLRLPSGHLPADKEISS